MKEKCIDVLIIEDDTFIGMDISDTIEELGHNVINVVTSFKDAIEEIKDTNIDLIISDVQIEGEQDGIDAVGVIQSIYNVPAIFITSFNDDETLQKASSVNMLGYIVKPYKSDDLISLVKIATLKAKPKEEIISNGEYKYKPHSKTLYFQDKKVNFTNNEKLLFDLLFYEREKYVSYEIVENVVWYGEVVSDTARRQLFHRLKNKLKDLEFETNKNHGYMLKF